MSFHRPQYNNNNSDPPPHSPNLHALVQGQGVRGFFKGMVKQLYVVGYGTPARDVWRQPSTPICKPEQVKLLISIHGLEVKDEAISLHHANAIKVPHTYRAFHLLFT